MPDKFGRRFQLLVESNDETNDIVIQNPFTLEFDISRNLFSSPSLSTLTIYNLNENTRSQIRKDYFDLQTRMNVVLRAGYGDVLPICVVGDVYSAFSVREGNRFATHITTYDGGFAFNNSVFNGTFPENTPQRTVIETIVRSLEPQGVSIGSIGSYEGTLSRGNSYSGSSTEQLRILTGGGFFIDNGKANCLNDGEYIFGEEFTIDSSSGLLGTPTREETQISFDMLFEPQLFIGQQITLTSSTGDVDVSGKYRINAIRHRGTISDAVCGDAVTTITCLTGVGTPVPSEVI